MTNYDLYSFDIFDTVITRKVAKPKGIFALMQHEININPKFADLPLDVKTNFFQYRENAEYRQRRLNAMWKDDKDITFNQLYKDLQETHYLTDEQTEALKELELKLEYENIVPINENILENAIKRINECISADIEFDGCGPIKTFEMCRENSIEIENKSNKNDMISGIISYIDSIGV